jgi:hypothetical protein
VLFVVYEYTKVFLTKLFDWKCLAMSEYSGKLLLL